MGLTSKDIDHIAHLAMIDTSAESEHDLGNELNKILDFVEQLQQIDTSNVEPLSHPIDATQPLREDAITEGNERDVLQSNAPEVQDGLYIVPAAINTPKNK